MMNSNKRGIALYLKDADAIAATGIAAQTPDLRSGSILRKRCRKPAVRSQRIQIAAQCWFERKPIGPACLSGGSFAVPWQAHRVVTGQGL